MMSDKPSCNTPADDADIEGIRDGASEAYDDHGDTHAYWELRLIAKIDQIQKRLDAMTLVADDHAMGRVKNSERYTADREKYQTALTIFDNRRKLAHSLRAESPHVAAFVEAIGVEIDKALSGEVNHGE